MADQSLEILIKIQSELAQLKQTVQGLEEAKQATQRGTEANKEHGKSFVELAEHSRGFHRLLHSITEESPVMGLALHAAFSGPGAVIAALVLAVRSFKKAEEEAMKAAEESALAAGESFIDVGSAVEKSVEQIHKAKEGYADYQKSLTENSKKISQELESNLVKLHAIVEAQKEIVKARGGAGEVDDLAVKKEELRLTEEARRKTEDELTKAKLVMLESRDSAAYGGRTEEAAKMAEAAQKDKEAAKKAHDDLIKAEQNRAEAQDRLRHPTMTDTLLNMLSPGSLVGMEGMGSARGRIAFQGAEGAENKAMREAREAENRAKKESDLAAKAKAEQEALDHATSEARKKVKELTDQLHELKTKAEALGIKVSVGETGAAMSGKGGDSIMTTLAGGASALSATSNKSLSPFGQREVQNLMNMLLALHQEQLLPIIKQNATDIGALTEIARQLQEAGRRNGAKIKSLMTP